MIERVNGVVTFFSAVSNNCSIGREKRKTAEKGSEFTGRQLSSTGGKLKREESAAEGFLL